MILGEVEGKDNVGNTRGVTRELLREGALNDLKNEAGNVVTGGKRIMLSITKEQVTCVAKLQGETMHVLLIAQMVHHMARSLLHYNLIESTPKYLSVETNNYFHHIT